MPTVIPQQYLALTQAAQACVDAGRLGDAEQPLREIVQINPREHYAWGLLARIALERGDCGVACEHIQRALELDRRNADYLNVLAIAQAESGDLGRAEASLRRALRERPTHADAHYNLGKVFEKRRDFAVARREYERTLSLDANHQGARANLSRVLRFLGDVEGAVAALEASVASGAAEPLNIALYGKALMAACGHAAAIDAYADACRRLPGSGLLRREYAHALLAAGDFARGWREYLGRDVGGPAPRATVPEPLPQHLAGHTIRLVPEQGLGDILFFLRFAPELVARGASVRATVPQALVPLLAPTGIFAHVSAMLDPGESNAVSVADLPCLLASDGPAPVLPLVAEAARVDHWRSRLAELGPAPHIGVTWRAGTDFRRGPEFSRDARALSKEIDVADLAGALREVPGTFVSLQRQLVDGEIAVLSDSARRPVHDLAAANEDLASMAGLLAVLDEYVAVSNTNVHLRAGLGRTSRLLVPFPPEWRWMAEGDESPWFPGCRVYRQSPARGWAPALHALRADLLESAAHDVHRPFQQE
jgi:Flp pilus assembly protein TadD